MAEYYPKAYRAGEFVRPETRFRDWVKADGSTRFQPEAGRYHLYLSSACPWSQRVMILRSARKLEDFISMSVSQPVWNEKGWTFDSGNDAIGDLIDLYLKVAPDFDGEETVPVLWDKKLQTIVNNESVEIIRMLDVEFAHAGFGDPEVCFYPKGMERRIDATIRELYDSVNNGVYKTGFARTQQAYESACRKLFEALDYWDEVLSRQRYLCGSVITEADVAFYVTLVRFDSVYYSHFKCNLMRIEEYLNLSGYLRDLYQTPGFGETTDFSQIKRHYYESQTDLNPSGIVPLGPSLNLMSPHGRTEFHPLLAVEEG